MEPNWSDVGSGWFLERIDVKGPGDQRLSFPCNTWLGKSDAGDFDGDHACSFVWNKSNVLTFKQSRMPLHKIFYKCNKDALGHHDSANVADPASAARSAL